MKSYTLHDYQTQAEVDLKAGFMQGLKSQVLALPTGTGKTMIAIDIVKRTLAAGHTVTFFANREVLVWQASKEFSKYGIEHGILQGVNSCRTWNKCLIASVQTAASRNLDTTRDLVIVDEAHERSKFLNHYLKDHAKRFIGLTATPFTRGIGNTYEKLVSTITTNDAIHQGYLSPYHVYAARKQVDMQGARKNKFGEWTDRTSSERVIPIIGDAVSEWQKKSNEHFSGPVKTLLYSPTVDDGIMFQKKFHDIGINAEQVSYKKNPEHNGKVIKEFRKPDSSIMVLISCEALVKGADFPDVKILSMVRPYSKSFIAMIQMVGRALRTHENKEYALIIDHVGNWLRFQKGIESLYERGPKGLSKIEDAYSDKEPTSREKKTRICECGYIFKFREMKCPLCNKPRIHSGTTTDYEPGELHKIASSKPAREQEAWLTNSTSVWYQLCTHAHSRKPDDRVKANKIALAIYYKLYGKGPFCSFIPFKKNVSKELNAYLARERRKFLKQRHAIQNSYSKSKSGRR